MDMHLAASSLVAGVIVLGSFATATARPAMTTYLANMRTGPGVGYPVVAAIPESSVVDMGACTKSWCRVTWNGLSGFVSAGLLTRNLPRAALPTAPVQEEYAVTYPYVYGGYGPYFCDPYFDPYCYNYVYFDGGGWYWYDRRRHRWRPHPGPRPRPPHGQPRPRPDAGYRGTPSRFIPGAPRAASGGLGLPPGSFIGSPRGVPGSIGAPRVFPGAYSRPGGAIGGGAPRGGSIGAPSVGGSRGGFSGLRGGFGGGRGGGAIGGGHGR